MLAPSAVLSGSHLLIKHPRTLRHRLGSQGYRDAASLAIQIGVHNGKFNLPPGCFRGEWTEIRIGVRQVVVGLGPCCRKRRDTLDYESGGKDRSAEADGFVERHPAAFQGDKVASWELRLAEQTRSRDLFRTAVMWPPTGLIMPVTAHRPLQWSLPSKEDHQHEHCH
jgi:hypothetical protein